MQINKKIDYGLILIRALKDTFKSGNFIALEEISGNYSLPYAFLEKLAGKLKQAGILESQKGKNGGYRLAIKPSLISMGNIMDIFQEKPAPNCNDCYLSRTCSSISGLRKIDAAIKKTLEKFKVSNL